MEDIEFKDEAQPLQVESSEQESDNLKHSGFAEADEIENQGSEQEPDKHTSSVVEHASSPSQQLVDPVSGWAGRIKPTGPAPYAKILVPLYIYPVSEQTWQPLYQAISNNPNYEFVIVVNPNSGPGGNALPSHDYMREIPKLNNYRNVQTVGYMRIDWCRRPLSETFADIETFARWSTSGRPGLYVEGIYVDETPNHFTEERAQYLHAVRKYIRALPGFSNRRLIFENPGTPPDKELTRYANCGPDVTVTCEEPYERFTRDDIQHRLREFYYDQPQSAYQISGIPRELVGSFTRELRHRGAYLFATDLVDDFYESFGVSWFDFIAAF